MLDEIYQTLVSLSDKGGSKQECVNLEAFIFNSNVYQSLKNMMVVFFL
jgi:hypothetical protein